MSEHYPPSTVRRAIHEASHAIICKTCGIPYRQASLHQVDLRAGGRHPDNSPNNQLLLRVSGYAGERLVFGDAQFGGSDRRLAEALAQAMEPEEAPELLARAVLECQCRLLDNYGPLQEIARGLCRANWLTAERIEEIWNATSTEVRFRQMAQSLREERKQRPKLRSMVTKPAPKPAHQWQSAPTVALIQDRTPSGVRFCGDDEGQLLCQ